MKVSKPSLPKEEGWEAFPKLVCGSVLRQTCLETLLWSHELGKSIPGPGLLTALAAHVSFRDPVLSSMY